MIDNTIKLAKEIKSKVSGLDDLQISERMASVEFFKLMNTVYGEDFTNRVLEAFIDFDDDRYINCIFIENGTLYELYNGKEYILDGRDILAHSPLYPSDENMKDFIEEAMTEFL